MSYVMKMMTPTQTHMDFLNPSSSEDANWHISEWLGDMSDNEIVSEIVALWSKVDFHTSVIRAGDSWEIANGALYDSHNLALLSQVFDDYMSTM